MGDLLQAALSTQPPRRRTPSEPGVEKHSEGGAAWDAPLPRRKCARGPTDGNGAPGGSALQRVRAWEIKSGLRTTLPCLRLVRSLRRHNLQVATAATLLAQPNRLGDAAASEAGASAALSEGCACAELCRAVPCRSGGGLSVTCCSVRPPSICGAIGGVKWSTLHSRDLLREGGPRERWSGLLENGPSYVYLPLFLGHLGFVSWVLCFSEVWFCCLVAWKPEYILHIQRSFIFTAKSFSP